MRPEGIETGEILSVYLLPGKTHMATVTLLLVAPIFLGTTTLANRVANISAVGKGSLPMYTNPTSDGEGNTASFVSVEPCHTSTTMDRGKH